MTIPTADFFFNDTATAESYTLPLLGALPNYAPLIPNRDVNQFTRNAAELMQVRIGVGADRIRDRHVAGNRRSASLACREPLDLKAVGAGGVEIGVLNLDGIRARRR